MGKLIVIEGLDGSGKATQTGILVDNLEKAGFSPKRLSFPCYDSPACAPVRMYLNGEFGEHASDVNGYAASVLFAVDRFASFRTGWKKDYDAGGLFVADRYTTSNAVYQTGKLPAESWDDFTNWLFDFEYCRMGIPKPDRVVYLDVSAKTGSELMAKRYSGDEGKRDIHEKDIEFQIHCREAALHCARKNGWIIIECDRDGAMRPIEKIAAEVYLAATEGLI